MSARKLQGIATVLMLLVGALGVTACETIEEGAESVEDAVD